MDALLASIKRIRPLDARRERALPGDVRSLWASLTKERESRKSAYLSDPGSLSAYLRYFLPWNVYRYLRLLPSLDISFLLKEASPSMLDFGSGPLALPIALWLAKPELRSLPLELRALDRVPMAMEAGREILADLSLAVSGKLPAWRTVLLREGADAPIRGGCSLVSAAYFLSELDQGRPASLRDRATHAARILCQALDRGGRLLAIDSGDARSASLLSALRAELLSRGFALLAPCPHEEPCPMPGTFIQDRSGGGGATELIRGSDGRPLVLARGKRPWCHFTFEPELAPRELERVSERSGLPKTRASLSFLYAVRSSDEARPAEGGGSDYSGIRVVSESMRDPERGSMNYVCAKEGYCLLRHVPYMRPYRPGDLVLDAEIQRLGSGAPRRDPKTGALILESPEDRAQVPKRPREAERAEARPIARPVPRPAPRPRAEKRSGDGPAPRQRPGKGKRGSR